MECEHLGETEAEGNARFGEGAVTKVEAKVEMSVTVEQQGRRDCKAP